MNAVVTTTIHTVAGRLKGSARVPGLSEQETRDFNEIGYTRKIRGRRTSWEQYLNGLGKGTYEVTQLKYDNGDFQESYQLAYTPDDVEVTTYHIKTGSGSLYLSNLPFLNDSQTAEFDEIGYSGKLRGIGITREDYLNSLNLGQFSVEQTKFDDGNFIEEFCVTRITQKADKAS